MKRSTDEMRKGKVKRGEKKRKRGAESRCG